MQERIGGVVPCLVLTVSSYRYDGYLKGCRAVIVDDSCLPLEVGSVVKVVEFDLMGRAVDLPEPYFTPREDLFFKVSHICFACEGMSGRYCLLTIEKSELIENDYDKKI